MSAVGLLLDGAVNVVRNVFLRTGRGMLSGISYNFDVFISRKIATTYALGCFNWYLSQRIVAIAKCLSRSGPKQ